MCFSMIAVIAEANLLETYRSSTATGSKPTHYNTANSAKRSTTVDTKSNGMMGSQEEVCLHRKHFAYG